MKWLVAILTVMLVALQYRLWVGESSVAHNATLQQKIDQQRAENQRLRERNKALAIEIQALKSGTEAVEERAREEMGLIKKDETFFMIIEKDER
jgi:cell division protein FtsB